MIKKLKAYWGGKSVKQRVCICIVLTTMLTLLFFTVKANFIDKPTEPANTSEYAEMGEYQPPDKTETEPETTNKDGATYSTENTIAENSDLAEKEDLKFEKQ